MGQLFTRRTENGIEGLPVFSVTMDQGLVERSTLDRKMESNLSDAEHLLVRKGDIAYNMMRMWQGAFGLAYEDGLVSPAYVVLEPTELIDSLFASYFFKQPYTLKKFRDFSHGIADDRLRLYYEDFAAIPTRIPPKPEQQNIAEFLLSSDRHLKLASQKVELLRLQQQGFMQQIFSPSVPRDSVSRKSKG